MSQCYPMSSAGRFMPPPPPILPESPVPRPESRAVTDTPDWKRLLAITGVVCAFFYLLTIPGWFALARYRAWRRGEKPEPTFLVVFGGLNLVLLVLTIGVAAYGSSRAYTGGSSAPEVPTYAPGDPAASPVHVKTIVGVATDPWGPGAGDCGRIHGNSLTWRADAGCRPTDNAVVIEQILLPTTHSGPWIRGRLARRRCPSRTRFYSTNRLAIACWVPR